MRKTTSGFTIIELLVTISIIGILATIVIVNYGGYQKSIITTQLKSDLNGAATAMANVRSFSNTGYPSDINSLTTFQQSQNITLTGGSNDGGKTFCIDAVSSKDASLHFYIDSNSTSLDAKSGTCASIYPVPGSFTAIAASSSSINLSWSAVSGASNYKLQISTNSSFSDTTTIASQLGTTFTSSGLTPMTTYFYRVNDTTPAGVSGWAITSAATNPIDAPATPSVTANTVGTTTTWSWPAVTCNSGTPRYQYDYTISPSSYDSGWTATAGISIGFTTSTQGYTYTVSVQAQCYIGASSSNWSASGTVSYIYYGNAIAANLLTGKTATVDSGSITGTMPNKVGSATVITPTTVDQAIPIGYYGGVVGDGKVAGISIPTGNVLAGTAIAGQTGTMPNNGAIVITPNTSTQYIPAGYHNGSGYVAATAPKAYTAGNVEIGSLLKGSTPLGTSSTTPVKKASYLIYMGGVYRTTLSTVPQNSGDTNYLRIYKNGVPYGTTRANTYPSYAAYTEDLSFNAGDTLEFWLWSSNGNMAYMTLLGAGCSLVSVAEAPVVTRYP